MSEDYKLLKAQEVKEWLKISNTQLYDLIKQGKLPKPLKQGRSSFWKLGDIKEYVDNLSTAS
jgi:predicted DNA-binding transcriptional regulator AlpA